VHAYVAASSECWGLFAEMLPQVQERLFTDAYMTQHPDGDDPRQVQSVAVHLIALEAVLSRGQLRTKVEEILRAGIRVGREMGGFPILNRPDTWPWTILDVLRERTNGSDYATGVLDSWHQTEADRLGELTAATLQTLYA
jgi:Family of unknown function (DUF5946)